MELRNDSGATQTLRQGIAEEVRVLLARKRSNASKLAQDLGWRQQYLSRRMTCQTPFDSDDLMAIASVMGVRVVDLLPRDQRNGTVTASFPPGHTPVDTAALGVRTSPLPTQSKRTVVIAR